MIILVRHGQTATNVEGLLVGMTDVDLTEHGRRQALALRPHLRDVAEVWTSPLLRARATALIALPHVAHHEVVDDLREINYGAFEGRPLRSLSAEQWNHFVTNHDAVYDGGESLAQVDARVHASLEGLSADPSSPLHDPERHLALVSHVSPIKSAMAWALGVSGTVAWRSRLENGSMTTITARRGEPSLLRFNVVPALAD